MSDLVSLGICKRNEDSSIEFVKGIDGKENPKQILAQALIKSETVTLINEIIDSGTPTSNREDLAIKFKMELGKNWKESSSKRYVNGMLKYIEFLDLYNKELQQTSQ